ncbi:hypothetical protein N7G274_001266 [Stereocaulon virgatum]|uniref:Uncharacterized protein n=1 Tax=Stereocaulon virgatum TaxID=373712 RepID=A0ABR4ANC5_9LECA
MTSVPKLSANDLMSMFSRLFHNTRSIFPLPNSLVDAPLTADPDQQSQTELAKAVEEGMVATRSQDHTLDDLDVQDVVDQMPLSLRLKKGKVTGGEDGTPDQGTARKRRRTEGNSENGGVIATDASIHKDDTSTGQGGENGDFDGNNGRLRQDSPESRTTSVQLHTSQRNDDVDEEARTSVTEGVQVEEKPRSIVQNDDNDIISSSTSPQTTRRRKKLSKQDAAHGDLEHDRTPKDELFKSSEGNVPPVVKATKKRFGSEDIEMPITAPKAPEVEDVVDRTSVDASSESEDEAPETVTASAGLEKARAKAFETAETIARFKADRKIKRREHDSRLKIQAKSARQHAKTQRGSNAEHTTIGAQETEGKAKSSAKASLPILLPEEILAAEPVVRPPMPPSSTDKTAMKRKQKFFDAESRPPKDIKRGNVRIRVLQEERNILPPKASQTSKALRESWLAGRLGFKGNIVVPRKKLGGGFVRK